jgi:oligopeptide transport system ATP-binding protein
VTTLLEVQDLKVRFPVTGGVFARKIGEVRAVDGVSFTLDRGETLGVVGESGCGKSTVGRAVINILRAMSYGVEITGKVLYHHKNGVVDLASLSRSEMRPYRSDIQMIFQDPYSSLNPRMTVNQIVEEPLKIHTKDSSQVRRRKVGELLGKVGLTAEQANRYPHEFSGGQRQRIGIARALATNPQIIIADEPVSALDVSIQAQVINLMQDLQDEFHLSYIFIAHDLSVVRHIADRIAVMYLGNIVEIGPAELIYSAPLHPYSRALLSAVPRPDPDAPKNRRTHLVGDVPSPLQKPSGCAFRTRCPIARPTCADAVPPLEEKEGRWVACPWVP